MDLLDTLKRGREFYRQRAWAAAYQLLSLADQTTPLAEEHGSDMILLQQVCQCMGGGLHMAGVRRTHEGENHPGIFSLQRLTAW